MSTSLQRTYRNLRIGIAGTVVLIAISVCVAASDVGVLPSISAYYYTSARNVFVGALIAAAIAMLALSGSGRQRALLDAAALFAPLVALVPTPMRAGTVPGFENVCPISMSCVPVEVVPDIATGVATYLIAGSLTIVVAVIVTLVDGAAALSRNLPSLAIAAAVLLLVLLSWIFLREVFIGTAHLIAAVAFFGLIAVVAITNALEKTPSGLSNGLRRRIYSVIAAAMAVDIVAVIVVIVSGNTAAAAIPPVLVGEAVALVLFAVFWVVQSIEKWNDDDPTLFSAAGH